MALNLLPSRPAPSVNWDEDFVWFQKTLLLEIVADHGTHQTLRDPNGKICELSAYEVETKYFRVNGGRYLKPVYAPFKAHILKEPAWVIIKGDRIALEAGAALTRAEDGTLGHLNAAQLAREYRSVRPPSPATYPRVSDWAAAAFSKPPQNSAPGSLSADPHHPA